MWPSRKQIDKHISLYKRWASLRSAPTYLFSPTYEIGLNLDKEFFKQAVQPHLFLFRAIHDVGMLFLKVNLDHDSQQYILQTPN